MVKEAEHRYKNDLVRNLWLFPYGSHLKDGTVLFTDDKTREAYSTWLGRLCNRESEEEYDQILNDKLGELTKGLPDFYSP